MIAGKTSADGALPRGNHLDSHRDEQRYVPTFLRCCVHTCVPEVHKLFVNTLRITFRNRNIPWLLCFNLLCTKEKNPMKSGQKFHEHQTILSVGSVSYLRTTIRVKVSIPIPFSPFHPPSVPSIRKVSGPISSLRIHLKTLKGRLYLLTHKVQMKEVRTSFTGHKYMSPQVPCCHFLLLLNNIFFFMDWIDRGSWTSRTKRNLEKISRQQK